MRVAAMCATAGFMLGACGESDQSGGGGSSGVDAGAGAGGGTSGGAGGAAGSGGGASGCVSGTPCVRANFAATGHTIPATLFGDWIEWFNNANGLWDVASGAARPELMAALGELDVALLRYPGGTLSDFFDWSTAVGPVAGRQAQIIPFGSSATQLVTELPSFGPDEFAEVATALGAEMMITVNVGTGNADLAAAWLTYYRQRGINAKYWEVGNEVYMGGDSWDASVQRKTPEQYAAIFDEYAAKLRAVDPDIRVGALGCRDYVSFAFCDQPDWNARMLAAVSQRIDFLAVHNSYAPVLAGPYDPARDSAAYQTMLAAVEHIRENFDLHQADVAKFANGASKDLVYAVTEHAALFYPMLDTTPEAQMAQLARSRSLASALYSALLLDLFVADPTIAIANHINLHHPLYQAALHTGPDGFSQPTKTAYFHVFRLYAEAVGGRYVPVTFSDAPSFDAPGVTFFAGRNDVPVLHGIAVQMADRVHLYVVNRDLYEDVSAGVELAGLGPAPTSAVVRTLNADSFSAENTAATPNAVRITESVIAPASAFQFSFPAHSLTRITLQ
jgi:alpha-L-arabinofuranosidase